MNNGNGRKIIKGTDRDCINYKHMRAIQGGSLASAFKILVNHALPFRSRHNNLLPPHFYHSVYRNISLSW